MVTGDLHAFPGGVYAPVQHEQKLTCWRADRRIGRCAPVPPADPGRRSFDELAQLRAQGSGAPVLSRARLRGRGWLVPGVCWRS
jgi:hypothetical protein